MKTIIKIIIVCLLFAILPAPRVAKAGLISRAPNNLGLVGYWPMNEGQSSKAGDFSGNGNTGTITGATWADGKHGKGVNFANTGYISLGNVTAYKVATKTISFWAKPTATETYDMIFANGGANYYVTFSSSNNLFVSYSDANNIQRAFTLASGIVTLNTWAFYAVTFEVSGDNVVVSAYKNGGFVNSVTRTDGYSNSYGATFLIGAFSTSSLSFQGSLDEVRIYNRALSATEIATLYRSGQTTLRQASNQGLVGYWPMNEGRGQHAGDSSGNGNTGTITGATWVDGKRGKALDFDGTDDMVDLGDNFDFVSQSFTVCGWAKPTTGGYADGYLAGKYDGGANNGWYIRIISGVWNTGITSGDIMAGGTADMNVWQHICSVFVPAPGTAIVYKNGAQTNSTTGQTAMADNVRSAMIGNRWDNLRQFKGQIDDVRIYSRALSATEIATLYRSGSKIENAGQNSRITNGLVGLWSFNGYDYNSASTTAEVLDRSGQSYNGDNIGAAPAAGKVGQALSFDGTNDYVNLPTMQDTSGYTESMWIYMRASGGFLFTNDVCGSSWRSSANTATWYTRLVGGGTRDDFNLPALTANQWTHLVFTYDGITDVKRIYKDGQLEATKNPTTHGAGSLGLTATTCHYLGTTSGGGIIYFNGLIDEVRVYNRALSADEVKQLYNMGK